MNFNWTVFHIRFIEKIFRLRRGWMCLRLTWNMIYMPNSLEIHVFTWNSREIHILFTWNLCEPFTWISREIHMNFMWNSHIFHVKFMWTIHVKFTWISREIHISFTWKSHKFYVKFTWISHTIHTNFVFNLHVSHKIQRKIYFDSMRKVSAGAE